MQEQDVWLIRFDNARVLRDEHVLRLCKEGGDLIARHIPRLKQRASDKQNAVVLHELTHGQFSAGEGLVARVLPAQHHLRDGAHLHRRNTLHEVRVGHDILFLLLVVLQINDASEAITLIFLFCSIYHFLTAWYSWRTLPIEKTSDRTAGSWILGSFSASLTVSICTGSNVLDFLAILICSTKDDVHDECDTHNNKNRNPINDETGRAVYETDMIGLFCTN